MQNLLKGYFIGWFFVKPGVDIHFARQTLRRNGCTLHNDEESLPVHNDKGVFLRVSGMNQTECLSQLKRLKGVEAVSSYGTVKSKEHMAKSIKKEANRLDHRQGSRIVEGPAKQKSKNPTASTNQPSMPPTLPAGIATAGGTSGY